MMKTFMVVIHYMNGATYISSSACTNTANRRQNVLNIMGGDVKMVYGPTKLVHLENFSYIS